MLFSVVIPTHERVGLLSRTLETVFTQRFADYEAIVVDDGSTDGTQGYLATLGARVRALRQDNAGPGAARNAGIAQARGEYVAFLDSDDLWFPWTLEALATLIAVHGRPAIVAARAAEFRAEAELASIREEPPRGDHFPDFLAASAQPLSVGSGMATIRRDLLSSQGFATRPMNCEDHDLLLRLGTARGFVAVRAPTVLAYRRHSQGVTAGLHRTVAGSRYLVAQERAGAYPGGAARTRERREFISRHVRPVSIECLRRHAAAEAWSLYRSTLRWNFALGRWRYLAGFPAMALAHAFPARARG